LSNKNEEDQIWEIFNANAWIYSVKCNKYHLYKKNTKNRDKS